MLTALTLDDVIATELRTAGSAIEVEFWRGVHAIGPLQARVV